MIRARLPISIALLASVASCGSPSEPTYEVPEAPPPFQSVVEGQDVMLAIGGEVSVDAGALVIRFDEVVEDSRCPSTLACIWEGRGVVALTVTPEGGQETGVTLETRMTTARSATVGGYRIRLLGLLPHPVTETRIPDEDYRLVLEVEAVG